MRIYIILVCVLFMVLISIPFLYAFLSSDSDYAFGGFLFNPIDGNSYLAKMYQGWRGEWRARLAFTADQGKGAYYFVFYILLGHLGRVLNLPLIFVYHFARIACAGLLLVVIYQFLLAQKLPKKTLELVFTLTILGSGMGWVVFPFGVVTGDFWIAEAYPFLSSITNPHFTLGLAILLWLFLFPSNYSLVQKKNIHWRIGLLIGLAAFILGLIAPFGIIILLVVFSATLCFEIYSTILEQKERAQREVDKIKYYWTSLHEDERLSGYALKLLWLCIGGIPVLIYEYWIAYVDPIFSVWNAQNLTPSPAIWDVVLSLSPTLLFAFIGIIIFRQRENHFVILIIIWLVLGLALLYLPYSLQRRFMLGLFIPVVSLAGFSLAKLDSRSNPRWNYVIVFVLIFSLLTNIILILVALHGIQTRDPLLYLTRGESQALQWIEKETHPNALILASPQMGMFIPAHTGRRVIYGHPFETVNAQAEETAVLAFYQGNLPGSIPPSSFLVDREIDFVFYGPREKKLGDISSISNLVLVYQSQEVEIYSIDIAGERIQ